MWLTEIIPCQITQWHTRKIMHHLFRHITYIYIFFSSEIYCRLQTAITKKLNLWKQDSCDIVPIQYANVRCLLSVINMLELDALSLEDALIVLSLKTVQYAPSTKWIIPPNSKIWEEKNQQVKQMLWQEQKKTSYPNPINMQRGNLHIQWNEMVISLCCKRPGISSLNWILRCDRKGF